MKEYYLIEVTEVFGEFETSCKAIVVIDQSLTKDEQMKEVAKEWRGSSESDYEESLRGYWFFGNLVKIPYVIKELTSEEYCSCHEILVAFEGVGHE